MAAMDTNGAKVLIAKLHSEGLSNVEIAKRLEKQGYRSPRTGKPISQFGVGHHVRSMAEDKAPPISLAAPKDARATKAKPSRVRLALDLLNSDLPEAMREELAAKVLNS